jgi:hypothetical protein
MTVSTAVIVNSRNSFHQARVADRPVGGGDA